MRGMTAIIGPNGAGKSAIIDAVQTVLSGASMASIRFNPSAQSNVKSKRTLRDYCLGVVSLDEKGERSEPTRQHAYTYIILVFEDLDDGSAVSLGVAFSSSASRSEEVCEARFIAKGALTKGDILAAVGDDEVETLQWHAVRNALRARNIEVDDAFSSATDFVAESLRALSPAGFPLDPRRFQKAFRNALQLKPVDNPTDFVRNYVLDVQPLQVDRLRRGIEHWRSLTRRIEVEGPEREPRRDPPHRRSRRRERAGDCNHRLADRSPGMGEVSTGDQAAGTGPCAAADCRRKGRSRGDGGRGQTRHA
nr:ATP-binding protein [Bradyrhizobium sp. CW10]